MAQAMSNEHYSFNAVVILRIAGGPGEKTLRLLLDYLQRRHPLLSAHIFEKKGWYYFQTEGTPQIPLKTVKRRDENHWRQIAEEELDTNFDIFTGPLFRLTYLTDPGGKKESELIFTFQHAVIDAASIGGILNEALSLCAEIESGVSKEKFKKVEPLPFLPSIESFLPPAFKRLRRKWRLFSFMLRQMGDEFSYRLGTKGSRKAPVHPAAKNKILPMEFSKETSAALQKLCRKKRVTLTNLLTAAMLMAVHKHIYEGRPLPLRHVNTADLRPYLVPPLGVKHVGSYFAMMRYTVGMKETPQVWELARELNDIAYPALKRSDKFCTNLLSYRMMSMIFRTKSFRMGATALSYTGQILLEKNYGKIEVLDIRAFVSNFVVGPEYTALVNLFDGKINYNILYLDADMEQKQAGVIADEIRAVLKSAAEEKS